ncbi:hypothetical protein PR202_ga20242 [Eleusine coracana subsp. coracana]|uniref:Uncharacterized protein n=1 Tax=Eleusine coracana subsp. coracana TaxID=191504 RepID=A0AAV5CXN3_ELECO|nr:hypothetical protein PR202_ga20242 [Eleusine coracana subsp. coracana]
MDGSTNHPHITAILASLKYAYLPFGLAGLAASYAANTKTHLVGLRFWLFVGSVHCPSCRAAETSVVSPTVEGFTDLCLACGASRGDVGIGPVKTSGDGDEAASTEERELVVTKPVIAHLITLSSVIFAVATIGTFVYIAYMHFKIDGPMWEAVVSCAAESPLLLMPLCMVPRLRDAFVSTYATGLPDSSSSDLNTRLLASEIV